MSEGGGGESKRGESKGRSAETKKSLFGNKSDEQVMRDAFLAIVAKVPPRRQLVIVKPSNNVGQALLQLYLNEYRSRLMSAAKNALIKVYPEDQIESLANKYLDFIMTPEEKAGRIKAMKKKDKRHKKALKKKDAGYPAGLEEMREMLEDLTASQQTHRDAQQTHRDAQKRARTAAKRERNKQQNFRNETRKSLEQSEYQSMCDNVDIMMIFRRADFPCSPLYWHKKLMQKLWRLPTGGERLINLPSFIDLEGGAEKTIDLIYTWTRSVLDTLLSGVTGPTLLGVEAFGLIPTMTIGIGNVRNVSYTVRKLLRNIIEWAVSISMIAVQFSVIFGVYVLYDALTGSSIRERAYEYMQQYMQFILAGFVDALLLIPKTLAYFLNVPYSWDEEGKPDWGPGFGNMTNSEVFESDERLFQVVRATIDSCSDLIDTIKENLKKQKTIGKFVTTADNIVQVIKMFLAFGRDFALSLGFGVASVAKTTSGKLYNGTMVVVDNVLVAGEAIYKVYNNSWLSNELIEGGVWNSMTCWVFKNCALPAPPANSLFARPYNVHSVCALLNITEKELDSLNNKKLVKYVKNNPLCGIEVAHVAINVHRDLGFRPKQQNLRF